MNSVETDIVDASSASLSYQSMNTKLKEIEDNAVLVHSSVLVQ